MPGSINALIAVTRFGWGAAAGDINSIRGNERAWLEGQVKVDADEGWQQTLTVEAVFDDIVARQKAKKNAGQTENTKLSRKPIAALAQQAEINRLNYARVTRAPFVDRLSAFWANHFAISAKGQLLKGLGSLYEVQAIRPYVLGNFTSMLMAVTRHPAMLYYLDNSKSVGPNSRGGKRRGAGLNENLAREVFELHTLGSNGPYTQADITNFAKCLTGWTIDQQGRSGPPGSFIFNANTHEPGDHIVLGKARTEKGEEQANSVLAEIGVHPSTARHVAMKLARHFVADTPPKSLVSKLEKRFLETNGNLKEVSLALIQADEAWTPERNRFLPPLFFVLAVGKALPDAVKPAQLLASARKMGQPLWAPNSPEGYPDDNTSWLSANAMKLRLNLVDSVATKADIGNNVLDFSNKLFGDTLSTQTSKAISRAESARQGLTLLLMSPEFQRR